MSRKNFLSFFLLVLFLCSALPAHGQPYYVKGDGYYACSTEEQLDKLLSFARSDQVAFEKMIKGGDCFLLKKDVTVFIEQNTWTGKVKVRQEGSTESVWTVREAIK